MYAIVIYDTRMAEIAPISYQYIYNSMWFYIVIGMFCIMHLIANSNDSSTPETSTGDRKKSKCDVVVYISVVISMITLILNIMMFYNDLVIEPIHDAGISANEAIIVIITACMFMCFISWIRGVV